MSKDLRFTFLSLVISATIASLVSSFILTGSLHTSLDGGDVGLAVLPIILIFLSLSIAISLLSYIPSYVLLTRYAARRNREVVQIIHPRRDFVVALIPSWILSALIVYALVSLSFWFYPTKDTDSAHYQANQQSVVSPTPTSTPTLAIIKDEGTTVLHTAPLPTTIAFTPSAGSVAGASTDPQTTAVKAIMATINHALSVKESDDLYDLLSSQLTAVFDEQSLKDAFSGLSGTTGLQLIGEPKISGEWATQDTSYTNNGKVSKYTVVLHLENGRWKLFGTVAA
jgi:hypothetical protein